MKENEHDIFSKAKYFIGIKEFILNNLTGTLTGSMVLDHATASSINIFDSVRKQWQKEALEHCGIKTERLPELTGPEIIS